LFRKYRRGYNGSGAISDRYYEFFKKSLKQEEIDAPLLEEKKTEGSRQTRRHPRSVRALDFNALIFIFLIFDNGQIRTFTMELIPINILK